MAKARIVRVSSRSDPIIAVSRAGAPARMKSAVAIGARMIR
jgi:hypothetical protein